MPKSAVTAQMKIQRSLPQKPWRSDYKERPFLDHNAYQQTDLQK